MKMRDGFMGVRRSTRARVALVAAALTAWLRLLVTARTLRLVLPLSWPRRSCLRRSDAAACLLPQPHFGTVPESVRAVDDYRLAGLEPLRN
jgi:hypothetical protein